MYAAKERPQRVPFTRRMNARVQARLQLERTCGGDCCRTNSSSRISRRSTCNRPTGAVEALLRWRDPARRDPTDEFTRCRGIRMSVARRARAADACRQVVAWHARHDVPCPSTSRCSSCSTTAAQT